MMAARSVARASVALALGAGPRRGARPALARAPAPPRPPSRPSPPRAPTPRRAVITSSSPRAVPRIIASAPRPLAPSFARALTRRYAGGPSSSRAASRAAASRAGAGDGDDEARDDDEEDDDEAYDDDDDEAYDDDDDEAYDLSAMPFLVGDSTGGGPSLGVDVFVSSERGGPPDVSDETVSALTRDAETMTRRLLNPPPGSALPANRFPRSPSYAELSVTLCTDARIRELNREWREVDAATDVLSFPADSFDDVVVLGDCVVSVDTARRRVGGSGASDAAVLDELRVLLAHGVLHLAGMDHELGEAEAEAMARAEDELLEAVGMGAGRAGSRPTEEDGGGSDGGEGGDGGAGDDGRGGGATPRGLIRRVSDGSDDSAGSRREKFSPVTFGGGGAPRADCLVLDLDGTLLDRRCVVTPATAVALAECARRGVAVFIATGKARPAAIRAVGTAGTGLDGARTGICSLESPGVFLQGLDVFGRGGEALYSAAVSDALVAEAFESVYGTGGTDSDSDSSSLLPSEPGARARVALTAFCGDRCATLEAHALLDELSRKYHEPVSEVFSSASALCAMASGRDKKGGVENAGGVRKLLLMAEDPALVSAARPAWEAFAATRGAEVTQAVPNMLEVLPAGNDKARGVRTLLEHLGVERERVVAVGDGENDVGMLRLAGTGVAMANATEMTKNAARFVLERSNDEDGVAEAIERFVL